MVYIKIIGQIIFLWAVYRAGVFIVGTFHLALPGNVMGMIILFSLLCLRIIKPDQIRGAVDLLLKHLAFFFIPISVGLMTWGALIYQSGLKLLVALIVLAFFSLTATGLTVQMLHKEK